MTINKISDPKSWEIDVVNSPVPVFVDFWAEWCGPCRMVGPVIDELSGDYDDAVVSGFDFGVVVFDTYNRTVA